jgi:hypothetical protein
MLIERMRKRLSADRARFIEPCLPSPADKLPSGSNWIHEIKHDGFRLMVRRDPVGIRARFRCPPGRSPKKFGRHHPPAPSTVSRHCSKLWKPQLYVDAS